MSSLVTSCSASVFVRDDNLNRAIARVRKIASETAPGLFEIEINPRTRYRPMGPILNQIGLSAYFSFAATMAG